MDVLGQSAHHGTFENSISRAKGRAGFDHRPAFQNTLGANLDIIFDHAKGADFHVRANLSGRTYNCKRMNAH
jgi:hypothetical protein